MNTCLIKLNAMQWLQCNVAHTTESSAKMVNGSNIKDASLCEKKKKKNTYVL